MKRIVLLLLISLSQLTLCFSQTTSTDSVYVLTAEQLKLTNLIFAEHEYLSKQVPLLNSEISELKDLNLEYQKAIDEQSKRITKQERSIDKLKKVNKTKNLLIAGTSTGFLVSLILLVCGK